MPGVPEDADGQVHGTDLGQRLISVRLQILQCSMKENDTSAMIGRLPASLQRLLGTIQKELPGMMPDILVGIYIYGSISYGAFDAKRSDVDVVVVLKRKMVKEEMKKLARWLQSGRMASDEWIGRLEMDFVVLEDIASNVRNDTETTRFSGKRLKEKANMHGAAMDWENLRSCGIALYGKSPDSFVPGISRVLLFEALAEKFRSLKQDIPVWVKIDLWNQVFIVVQLCRVVYALENDGRPVSKEQATRWCKGSLPLRFREMISFALENMDAGTEPTAEILSRDLPAFLEYIDWLFMEKQKAIMGKG
jgi:predicted nucleotidyltransferase